MGGVIAVGRFLGIFPCRLILGRGILGVVLPLAPGFPLGAGRLLRMIGIIRWVVVIGGMLALPPRRSLESWLIGGVVTWLMVLKWLSVISSLRGGGPESNRALTIPVSRIVAVTRLAPGVGAVP